MNSWIKESIFYQIYPFGFCGVLEPNREYEEKNRLLMIEECIPHLKEMNINAIYFSPVFESTYHGYDTKDYYKIDKRLGTNEEFKNLCQKLHENDIKIVLDGVFNHVGRDFWAFNDVKEKGSSSPYANWFANLNFNNKSAYGDNFSYEGWNGCYDLVKLNLWNDEVVDHLLKAVEFWIDEFDIDGLRLDAADKVELEFFKKLRRCTEAKKEDFWLMGEIIHGDYKRWANDECLHSVTNYECYKGIYSSHNDKNYFEIAHSLNRLFGNGGIYKDLCLYNFVDNHDVNRLASTLKTDNYLNNVYTILYTMPGVPSIYYGSEYGIKGVKTNGSDDLLRPLYDIDKFKEENDKLCDLIIKLGKIRGESEALKEGAFDNVVIKNEQLVFSRTSKNDKIYVLLNLSDNESILDFDISFEEGVDLLDSSKEIITGGRVSIKVPAFSSKIIEKIK
ncbi:MAG: alpha-amylase [Clostridium butyricum]|nr:alpha-amylase [Clostridium butyricum]